MIAVLGPGAVGGLVAALLHRAGRDVVVVARPATADRIAEQGITVQSAVHGRWTAPVPTSTTVPAGSAVVVAVKAYALPDVLPLLQEARPREVLTLLNGLGHARVLHGTLGAGAVACASIAVEAARQDGLVQHRSDFCIVTVPDHAAAWETSTALGAAGITLRTGGTEPEVLWRKLRFLAPMALLTGWADAPLREALDHDRATTEALLVEVAALAGASGLPTTPEQLEHILDGFPATMRTSLQLDLRRGGPNELQALGGDLVELGRREHVPTPTLDRLVTELRGR